MKKKKAQHTAASEPSPSTSFSVPSDADLKAVIHDHSLFFDRLVELIPARFYLPVDDKERPWFHGLSKAAKASMKKESRENRKKARRERLDPEKSATTLDLLKKSIEAGKEESHPESLASGATGDKDADGADPGNRAVTFEDLQQRLRRRIEELRAQRNTKNQVSAKPGEDKNTKKRKRNEKGEDFGDEELNKPKEVADGEKKKKQKDASSVEFSFGHVRLGEGSDRGPKKRRLPKEKALKKAEQLHAAMKDPEKGVAVQQKHSWQAAVSRAAGDKVHDDPRLIKESLKKDKKRREKAAGKWKERQATKRKLMDERQKKRADNISDKIHQRKLKKIEKREKKLMRPGFEGRKEVM